MNKEEFEKLCRQIADVPWVFEVGYYGTAAKYADVQISSHAYNGGPTDVYLFSQDSIDHLRITFDRSPSPQQLATARSFFANLELEYIAREIAPRAKWVFGENHAQAGGVIIIRRFPEPWSMGVGSRWRSVGTTSGLIAAYREDRAKHEAFRGAKTHWVQPAHEWCPPDPDAITVEHARNIVKCMANPTKYTRIAEWAIHNPNEMYKILRIADVSSVVKEDSYYWYCWYRILFSRLEEEK